MVKVGKKRSNTNIKKESDADKLLKKLKSESEEKYAAALAEQLNLFYIDLNIFPISLEDLKLIPEEDSRRLEMVPFQRQGKEIRVGVVDPNKKGIEEYLKQIEKEEGWIPKVYVISSSSLEKALSRYSETKFLESLESVKISLSGDDLEKFEEDFGKLLDLKDRIRDIPTTEIVSTVMAGAVKMGASDIHFEPQEGKVRLRFRIDGVLQDIGDLPGDIYRFILSRIKMMGSMKINVRDIAQDGHFSVEMEKGEINVRVNVIPGNNGESVVMRLLDQSSIMLGVEDLGLKGLAYEQVNKQVEKPNGMILTTGPTGSGKTTTLYALINKLNTADIKIITVEDPIEYQVEGISQTQVEPERGYSFGEGLRAIVRQDPDVVLVGEIRDDETADVSLNAALTGHLVLSTLHTNSAAATVPRMLELGVKPNMISPAVNCFIAQRLVRKLCDCKEKYEPAKETVDSLKKLLSIISPKAKVEIPKDIQYLYRPKGCSKCHNLGYKGRIGIFEVLTINPDIEKIIGEMGGETEIAKAAIENGMVTMAQDGILKAVEGITSMDEVWSVTGQNEFLEEMYDQLMEQSLSKSIQIKEEDLKVLQEKADTLENFENLIKETNQKEALKYILAGSLLMGVGDIHIEPEEDWVVIRYRIDGILQNAAKIPINEYPTFLGEIKLLSGFKAEVRGGVKDGRFTISVEKPFENIKETKIDVRVSIILGGYGETVVLRILNKSAVSLDIEKLGIREQNLKRIMESVHKPNGIFLNTGPTGSGKTTTLYSVLSELNDPQVKIITVEDPIEYQVKGVLQTQVNDEDGYSFSTALRALLRQNPNIIMIGEIRDEETAEIAVEAALTGHGILSTLHTNDSAGSVHRLLNMGIKGDDLATALNAVMAQRLVRKLCDCKEKVKPSEEEKKKIEEAIEKISDKAGVEVPKPDYIYKPKGCDKCKDIGYKGRTTLTEVLIADRDVEELISRGALSSEISDKAVENGMITMRQDGILKVLEGETSLEEVERVTD